MKLFTIIFATTCLLSVCSTSFAQTSFISLKNVETTPVNPLTATSSIKFNPLGIAKGILKIKMFGQPAGNYTVQITDAAGKVLGTKEINHANGTTTEIADFGKDFTGGTYQVEVIAPDNKKTAQTIMLLI